MEGGGVTCGNYDCTSWYFCNLSWLDISTLHNKTSTSCYTVCVSPVTTVTLVELSTRLLHWLNWWLNMLNPMKQFLTPSSPPVGLVCVLTTLISAVSSSLNPLTFFPFFKKKKCSFYFAVWPLVYTQTDFSFRKLFPRWRYSRKLCFTVIFCVKCLFVRP